MRSLLSLATGLLLLAPPARAQWASPHPFSFAFGLGGTIPAGTFSNQVYPGLAVIIAGNYHPSSTTPFGLRVEGMFNNFGLTRGFVAAFPTFNGGNSQIIAGTADLVARGPHVGQRITTYAIGGTGLYYRRIEVDRNQNQIVPIYDPYYGYYYAEIPATLSSLTVHDTNIGFNGGAGVDYRLRDGAAFLEVRYHNIASSPHHTEIVPIVVGLHF